jgi:hypothetical protein
VSKNAEFHADFKYVENVLKKCTQKKLLAKNVMEICTIFTFILMFARLVLRIRNQREIPRFAISFLIKKKVLLVIIARYENFEAKRAKNGSKNQKTYSVIVS